MDLKLECDDGEDLFLSQSAEQMEQDFERFEDNMLSQVADYMERDYCLEQVMKNYVPNSGDFDLLDVNFDLGYLLPEQEDTKQDIKPDIKPESCPTEPGRFQVVSDDEMELLVQNQKNKNTGQNTKWALGVFNSWRAERNPNLPELLEMDPPTMNMALSRFVLEARKKTGEPYPGKTLYLICCGLLRHLRDYGSQINFLDEKDFAFCSFRKVLDSKMKELLSRGIGIEIKQAPAVLPQDEEKIWDTGVFGQNSSESLQYTMYFYNCKLFGLRAYDEHRDLTCEQFEIGRDSIGKYIHFVGKATKTFKGGLADKELKTKDIKYYCNDDTRCLADLFQTYMDALGGRGYFYRKPLAAQGAVTLRYGEQPVGINKIKRFMDTIAKKAGLQGKFSSHSGKRTCATALYQAGVDEQEIMSRTGHRSEKAVRKYKTPSAGVILNTSSALNPPPEKRIKRETSEQQVTLETVNDAPEPGNAENVPAIEKPKWKPGAERKFEVAQKLSDITNRMGPSDSLFFSNCTFNM